MKYLSPLAEAEIMTLESEGVKLTANDIVRINALAWRVELPQSRIALSRGVPVPVGGVVLWPMTLAGSDWFQRIGGQFKGEKKQTYALAYAMANGRENLPENPEEAGQKVARWARSLKCRHAELIEAIRQVHDQWDMIDTGEKGPKASVGELSMMLSAMTGVKPEVWEYQCSIQYVIEMLETITAQNDAEGRSTKHDPRIKAERALGLIISKIKARHEKEVRNG